VLNSQRLAIYAQRRVALLGTAEDVDRVVRDAMEGDEAVVGAYEAKQAEVPAGALTALMRRLVLQVTDAFWLEQLDTMEYMRRSVSLRAYGQRDPLVEYRREGSLRFKQMEAGIKQAVKEAIPRIRPADDAKIRAEEERIRRAMVAASAGGDDGSPAAREPVVHQGAQYGRNDQVTIRKGDETQTLKYKKAETLLAEGWSIVS
jgi:preprotein translocase subunit SecA